MAKSDNNLCLFLMRPFSTVIDPILIFLDVLKRYEPISFIFDINVVIAVTMTMSISDYVGGIFRFFEILKFFDFSIFFQKQKL